MPSWPDSWGVAMRPDPGGRALLAMLPPALALAAGVWSARPTPAEPARQPEVASAPPPRPHPATARHTPRCDDPLLDELVAIEARWAEHEAEVAFRRARAEDALYDALESCDIELDVAEVDCREEPCLIITRGGASYWWNRLGLCPAWYDLYGGGGTYATGEVPCGDGRSEPVELMEEPRRFYGLELVSDLGEPDLIMKEMKLSRLVYQARLEDLAADWSCASAEP
jgi:hypothetical protein